MHDRRTVDLVQLPAECGADAATSYRSMRFEMRSRRAIVITPVFSTGPGSLTQPSAANGRVLGLIRKQNTTPDSNILLGSGWGSYAGAISSQFEFASQLHHNLGPVYTAAPMGWRANGRLPRLRTHETLRQARTFSRLWVDGDRTTVPHPPEWNSLLSSTAT